MIFRRLQAALEEGGLVLPSPRSSRSWWRICRRTTPRRASTKSSKKTLLLPWMLRSRWRPRRRGRWRRRRMRWRACWTQWSRGRRGWTMPGSISLPLTQLLLMSPPTGCLQKIPLSYFLITFFEGTQIRLVLRGEWWHRETRLSHTRRVCMKRNVFQYWTFPHR